MRWRATTPHPVLVEALGPVAGAASDIRDHLGTLFIESVAARPRLILELGTRGGVSTRALLAAAQVTGAQVLSVDIEDCSQIDMPARFLDRWTFVRADDLEFAGAPFERACADRGLPPLAEVIFVDTSHRLEHTRAEIAAWTRRLAPRGVMMFHDTNMGAGWYRKLDGKVERGRETTRGVIQAIEEHVGRRYAEDSFFTDVAGGYAICHVPWSSGFTILRKLEDA